MYYCLLKEYGIILDVVLGLSLGEYLVLVVSDVLFFIEVVVLVVKRGVYMMEVVLVGSGKMVVVMNVLIEMIEESCYEVSKYGIVFFVNYNIF